MRQASARLAPRKARKPEPEAQAVDRTPDSFTEIGVRTSKESIHDLPANCNTRSDRASFQQRLRLLRVLQFAGRSCMLSDRKSTRLNSSHQIISYAVFCLKKK